MKTSSRFFFGILALMSLVITTVLLTAFVPSTQTKLIPADVAQFGVFQEFGYAVAIDGDTAVVGAPLDGQAAESAGAAYVFVHDGSNWVEQAKLVASDAARSAQFGNAVALSGDTIVVGAHLDGANGVSAGAAYVFVRSGTTWNQQARLVASDPGPSEQFGCAVAIEADTVAVGALGDGTVFAGTGAVYVFERGGGTWTQQAKLVSNNPQPGNALGLSVGLSGDTIVTGSPFDEDAGILDAGAVYVFSRTGTAWNQEAELRAADAGLNDHLGWSVSVSGDTLLAGAPDQNGLGAAYVFRRAAGIWSLQTKLTADDGGSGDSFGVSVSVAGNNAVVGADLGSLSVADGGSAYVFRRSGTTWSQESEISAQDLVASAGFGSSVSLSGTTILVGAPFNGGLFEGAAYVFASEGNSAPVANPQSLATDEDTLAALTLTGSDAEGDALTFSVLTAPTKGTLGGTAPNLTYTPNGNANGSDSFTFKVNDGALDSAEATVSITITPVNDTPTANAQAVTTLEDTAAGITLTGSDVENNALTFTVLTAPTKGTLGGTAPNLTYMPNANANGSDSFTFRVNDGALDSAEATVSITITPVNDAPTADGQGVATLRNTPVAIQLTGADSDPETAQTLTFAIVEGPSLGTLSGFDPVTGQLLYTPALDSEGLDTFTFTVTDDATAGGTALTSVPATVAIAVSPGNSLPVLSPPDVTPSAVNENDTVTVSGLLTDADATDAHLIAIAWGDGAPDTVLELAPGVLAYSATHQYLDDQPTGTPSDANLVTVTAADGHGGTASATTTVTVNNLPPVVTSVEGPTSPLPVGSAAGVSVTFGDAGTLDTHIVQISWDDGTADTVLSSGGFTRTATHTYAAAGVYTVGITVTDDDTGVATALFQYIVIHEPIGGFVTGGGWINSPPGAYVADPSLSGKASFGFVAKNKSGILVPVGETEFQLHVAKFKFRSTVYESLVIAGPTAQYAGSGTVNGAGNYGFLVTATDGQIAGGFGVDGFRIKIWDRATGAVAYDNVLGAPDGVGAANPQEIDGGSIVIHKAK